MKNLNRQSIKEVQEEVFEDEDFNRMIKETAEKENLPLEVVEGVIKNFIIQLLKLAHLRQIKISVFGYFNLYKKYVSKRKIIIS